MRRVAFGVQYDGAAFSGWQSQLHGSTVQDTLERALATFTGTPLRIIAAGRTDTGVHALGQVVHFDTELQRLEFSWVRGINALLPRSVAVMWAREVSADFHARFSASQRHYEYVLFIGPVRPPHFVGRAGWLHTPLDVDAMCEAATCLLGEHDFSAFRSSQCQARSPLKHMRRLDIAARGGFIHFRFSADAFLHHMVRNIMGCLVAIGRGKYPPGWLAEVLESRDRRVAASTFMPDGLYLMRVDYPERFAIPAPDAACLPGDHRWE